ncbi:hypothetical protein Tco_1158133 [Tanacetum coccineum]
MFVVCACARDLPFNLEAFSVSDYAGASLDRKSIIEGCQFLGKRLISWQCKKQTIVANSTIKAKYIAAANCCGQGEGSTIPAGSQHTPLLAPSTKIHSNTRAQSPITEPHTSPLQITKPPTSSTIRETIKPEVEIPQSNFPTQTLVHGGAATTVSSIDARQGGGNIPKSPTMPHDSPLPGGHTPRSNECSLPLHVLTVLYTKLLNKVERLETELNQTKQIYGDAFTKLIKKVKKLEHTVQTSQDRRRAKIVVYDDEEDEEDLSKQGRSLIEEMDLDARISLVPPQVSIDVPEVTTANAELNTTSRFVSTASPQIHTDTTAETLMEIRKIAAKTKVREKFSEEDLPMKLVELFDQRKNFFVQQRAEAKRNKPMTPTQQKERVQSFVPMGSELEIQKLKRAGQEVFEEPAKRNKIGEASGLSDEQLAELEKELPKEELQTLLVIVLVEEVYVESLQERFSTTKPTDDKEMELWVELKRLFKPDDGDTLWKLQRYMHDPLVWRFYDTCGVHHVSSVRGHDIFMLVEKDYPLSKALMMLMLVSKLSLEQSSEMENEFLRKTFRPANSPRK